MFKWFRRKKTKKEEKYAMTYEQIIKAYEDLSDDDKKKFHQTLKDRIDESVGEQEHLDGDKDSQTAKARVDESLGEEKHLDKAKEERKEEHMEREEEHFDRMDELFKRIDDLNAKVEAISKAPKEADKSESEELDKIYKKWD